MFIDGLTLLRGSSASGFNVESGPAFPVDPVDGLWWRLTETVGSNAPGEYWYDGLNEAWISTVGGGGSGGAVESVNGQTGAVIVNAANLPNLATVGKTGSYSDLLNTPAAYTLPVATSSVLGGVKAGTGVSIAGDGTLSATGAGVSSINTKTGAVVIAGGTGITVDNSGSNVALGLNLTDTLIISGLGYTPVNKSGDVLQGALNFAPFTNMSSAATVALGASGTNNVNITGTTTITAFDTIAAGAMRFVTFAGVLTLTYNATSMILPTAANIVTAAGDSALFVSLGSGNWKCLSYDRASGVPLVGASDSTKLPLAGGTMSGALNEAPFVAVTAAATSAVGTAASNNVTLNGTTTVTAFDTAVAGAVRRVVFGASLTLTHNASTFILPTAANIVTAAGDVAEFVSLGSGSWRCIFYTKAGFVPASLAGTESFTNKTLVNPTITNFSESGVAASSAAYTVDLANGTDFEITTTANLTVTLPTPVAGKSYTVTIVYGGAHTVTFSGGGTIKYPNSAAPTATSVSGKVDIYVMKCNRAATTTFIQDGGRNF